MTDTLHEATTTSRTGRRSTWWLWGTTAGVLGILTNVVLASGKDLGEERVTAAVVETLSRGPFHAAAVTGYLAVAALLMFAAGLSRWADLQASASLALRAAPLAVAAAAAALTIGYGVKGQLAEYLPGGMNPDNFSSEGLFVFYLLDDLAGYFGWLGVTVAGACLAWLSLRERLLPRWIGAVAALLVLPPVLFLLLTGFTGFSGLSGPVLLVVVGTGMALRRE